MNGKGRSSGFTMIEIMIISFIGLTIIMLVVGLVYRSKELGRTMACISNMKQITQAIETYQADYGDAPVSLEALKPPYISTTKIFHCPSDRGTVNNSYEGSYVSRFFQEEDTNKMFLACNRHFKGTKTVTAYLSYAVDVGSTLRATWSGVPAEFGKLYSGGTLRFADGTSVNIVSGEVGISSSFIDNTGRIYSVIYVPESASGSASEIQVEHHGNSRFEVITPAVIAGVAGTKFGVRTYWTEEACMTAVAVTEGAVNVASYQDGDRITVPTGNQKTVRTARWQDVIQRGRPPRRPPRGRAVGHLRFSME